MLEDAFADIIGKARFGKGWSLSELKGRTQIEDSRISALEEEAPPTHDEIMSLAASLDLDPEKLEDSAKAAWSPRISPPYLVEGEGLTLKDMIHVVDGKIGTYPVNGYLFTDWQQGECVLFDTGYSPDKVKAFLAETGLRLVAICLTHAHPDHIGGIQDIQSRVDAPVYLNNKEASGSIRLKQHIAVTDKKTIDCGRFQITARSTPGHTNGGTTYYMDTAPIVPKKLAFVGDALFAGSIGRAKATETYDTLLRSVKDVILSFPAETLLFPGHGPVTMVGEEQKHNPFFKN
ncbi:MAG: MBL fold metallo-hydrolase [Nitrospiria bacterium]